MQREFYYVNLNSNESIFLFAEKYTDYHVVVEKMYRFFAYQFDSECYFAVSKEIEDRKNLAEEFKDFANSILPYDVSMTQKIDIEKY